MTRVYAGLGSNVDKDKNIPAGLSALADHFSPLAVSTVYESEPLGFRGDNFYNLVVGFDTDLSALQVVKIFKSIESSSGRLPSSQNDTFGTISHTLDIDLLLFGDLVQHDDQIDVPRNDIKQFEQAGRDDLAAKEDFELKIIQEYLPAQLTEDEISQIITECVAASGAESTKDMGKVMGLLKPRLQGRADMGKVSGLVKQQLS